MQWGEDVFRALQALPSSSAPPVCPWTQPAEKVAMPSTEEDVWDEKHPLIIPTVYVAGAIPVIAVLAARWWLLS